MAATWIDPTAWLEVAKKRAPKKSHLSRWHSGTTHPAIPGWYERYFIDAPLVGLVRHYWTGTEWRTREATGRHWRQVGDYPCWRGVTFTEYMKGTAA